MTAHTLTVAALVVVFLVGMALLVAVVTLTEPGAYERYRRGLAYHRAGARHAKRREAGDETADEPTAPALTAVPEARTA